VKNTRRPKITVSADGKGIVSYAGGLLLAETVRVTGLGGGLSQGLSRWRARCPHLDALADHVTEFAGMRAVRGG
jgi:hypothetical protein